MASAMYCASNTARFLRLLTLTPKLKISKFYTGKNSVSIDSIFSLSKGRSISTGVSGLCGSGILSSGRNMIFSSRVINHRHSNILQGHFIITSMDNSRNFSNLRSPLLLECTKLSNQTTMTFWSRRYVATKEITKNMTLLSKEPIKGEVDPKTLEIKQTTGNPLVLMMAWLMARQKHLKKYAEIYTDMGFDVIVVHVTPWQLLWPVKGTQVVAADTLKFMENNKLYTPIVVHGFSVGAYQIGEVMLQMARDIDRYELCKIYS